MVFNWIRKFNGKKVITKIRIFENEIFPNYSSLEEFASVKIMTDTGESVFLIKEDKRNRWLQTKLFGHRYYTVELVPLTGLHDNRELYEGKLMLAVKLEFFYLPRKLLIEILIETYLDNITRRELFR